MIYIFLWCTFIINLINSIAKKHSKLISFTLIIFLCIVMGANTNNADYYSYEDLFNLQPNSVEAGFLLIIKLFNFVGLNYVAFRLILAIVGILLIHQTVKKITDNFSCFYMLYFIFPFFIDAVQIRNFLAMSIFIYAVPCLMDDNLKNRIKYILLIILASSIHISAITYLIFLLVNKVKKNVLIKYLFILVIMSMVILSLNRSIFIIIVGNLLNYIESLSDHIQYYGEVLTRWGYLFYWGVQLSFTYITKILSKEKLNFSKESMSVGKREMQTGESIKKEDIVNNFCEFIFWVNVISLIFMPTYVIQIIYFRFYRNIIPLNYIAIISKLKYLPQKSLKKRIITIALIGLSIALFFIDIYNPFRIGVVDAIFKNNWIFN